MLKNELRILFTCLMYYTRIPCPKWVGHSADNLNKASRYIPFIGWIAGTVFYLSLFLSLLIFPLEIAVILSMVTGILLTGAFHEDGFADVCDGFGGGWTKLKILEIMKDSRIGTYGVTGLILILFLKFYTIKNIINTGNTESIAQIIIFLVFVTAHSVSRLISYSVVFTNHYVREDSESKAKPIVQNFTWKEVTGSVLFGVAPLVWLMTFHYQFIYTLIPLIVTRILMARYFNKWIGGYTGDCLGATQQVCEIVFYLSVLVIWKFI